MAQKREKPSRRRTDPGLNLEGVRSTPSDQGLSLNELSDAFVRMLDHGADPYDPRGSAGVQDTSTSASPAELAPDSDEWTVAESDDGPTTPKSILEAILFVGNPQNEPITAQSVARLMRGVRSAEVEELVRELNEQYQAEERPYEIISDGPGYRMQLRPEFESVSRRLSGRTRDVRLSQAAIEILAAVAYNESLTREEVQQLRGKPSARMLAQLVRRRLLRVEREEEKPRVTRYFTTDRFLSVFGLESLADLPRGQELDRR